MGWKRFPIASLKETKQNKGLERAESLLPLFPFTSILKGNPNMPQLFIDLFFLSISLIQRKHKHI